MCEAEADAMFSLTRFVVFGLLCFNHYFLLLLLYCNVLVKPHCAATRNEQQSDTNLTRHNVNNKATNKQNWQREGYSNEQCHFVVRANCTCQDFGPGAWSRDWENKKEEASE